MTNSALEMMPNEKETEQFDFLHVPDPSIITRPLPTQSFLKAAISLKEQVVEGTWNCKQGRSGESIDATVYTGLLGTAFACLRSFEATGNEQDLLLCDEIVDKCAGVAANSKRHVTFLCGRAGVYAIGAVVAHYRNDHQRRHLFLGLFIEMAQEKALPVGPDEGGFGMSYELLYGRTGFLWAALFINKHLGQETLPRSLLMPVVEAVVAGGRVGASDNMNCPLMYRWHGTRYWGAAHGLAGILHVLLHFPLSGEDIEDVKGTLRYMVRNRFPHSGNYPSSEGNLRDKLVQWSHGATGVAITLCKAAQVFSDDREFRDAAIEAGEVVWKKGLVRKVGLADGTSGNAYAFLSLYRLTGDKVYEDRAKAFAGFLCGNSSNLVADNITLRGDRAFSLFQGLAGVACLFFDVASPENSRFPGFEL
ncbi:hypothetical protein MRB53_015298 [Persea americana]|uniref:Uncharacterized protein n=1 Tax=Persea americana TaxID=3435 RepID=A0ACC2KDR1_PERAE|nr:hypothetical protein MRB53_015298 [Persea americana]